MDIIDAWNRSLAIASCGLIIIYVLVSMALLTRWVSYVRWNHCFRKIVSYDMWLSRHRYSESRFWSFLSNTKNGANFNLPTPYGRTTIHEKLSASGRRGEGEATPWRGPDKNPLLDPGSRWSLRPYPPVIGFMVGWHWQKCGFQCAFTVQTARNLVSWFSGKSLKLLPPDVRF